MASDKKFAQDLARSIMASAVKGQNVPMDVQNAAERVQLGAGTRADLAIMMKFRGTRRTGAGKLKRAARNLQMFGDTLGDLSREASIISAMGTNASATDYARFSQTVLTKVEQYTRTKGIKAIAERVVPMISSSPGLANRLLLGLRGVARLGGAAAMIASMGIDVTEHYFKSQAQSANAQGRMIDQARALGMSPELRREIEAHARRRYDNSTGMARKAYDYFFPGARDNSIAEDASGTTDLLSTYIKNIGSTGTTAGSIIAQEAGRKGGALSKDEARAALDAYAQGQRQKVRSGLQDQVDRKIDQEFGWGASAWEDVNSLNRLGLGALGIVASTEELKRARREKLYEELERKELEKREKMKAEIEASTKRMREGRTAAERLAHSRAQANARAEFTSFASRHKTWNWG